MALLALRQQGGNGTRRPRRFSVAEQLSCHDLTNIVECFRDQAAMYPLQCSAAVEQLDLLRQAAHKECERLCSLDPEITRQLRPYACIDKLTLLDYQLTELILSIAMLAPICQSVSYERIDLHLFIRSLLPRTLTTFEDTMSQLVALTDTERRGVQA